MSFQGLPKDLKSLVDSSVSADLALCVLQRQSFPCAHCTAETESCTRCSFSRLDAGDKITHRTFDPDVSHLTNRKALDGLLTALKYDLGEQDEKQAWLGSKLLATITQNGCIAGIDHQQYEPKLLDPQFSAGDFSSHLQCFSTVYEPAEDSYLLMDALWADMRGLCSRFGSNERVRMLEIGSGSGTVACYAFNCLRAMFSACALEGNERSTDGSKDSDETSQDMTICSKVDVPTLHLTTTDINPMACVATLLTIQWNTGLSAREAKACVDVRCCDLVSETQGGNARDCTENESDSKGIDPKQKVHNVGTSPESVDEGKESSVSERKTSAGSEFDILIFNPPYVPSEDGEIGERNLIDAAWAGGEQGRLEFDRLLKRLPSLVSAQCVCYFVALVANDVPDMLAELAKLSMLGQIVRFRKVGVEKLCILRVTREQVPFRSHAKCDAGKKK